MFQALKKIFSRKTPPTGKSGEVSKSALLAGQAPHFITDAKQILKVLLDLKDDRLLFNVTLPQANGKFSSALLEVNGEQGYVMLDELIPEIGHKFLQEKKTLRVHAVLRGIDVSFDLGNIETGHSQGIAYYKAALPKKVYFPQRRNARRLSIKPGSSLSFYALYGDVNIPVHGNVLDLSGGGIGVILTNNRARICRGGILKNCRVVLSENEEIQFDLKLRFVKSHPSGNNRLHIGGYFENLTPDCQKKLQRHLRAGTAK